MNQLQAANIPSYKVQPWRSRRTISPTFTESEAKQLLATELNAGVGDNGVSINALRIFLILNATEAYPELDGAEIVKESLKQVRATHELRHFIATGSGGASLSPEAHRLFYEAKMKNHQERVQRHIFLNEKDYAAVQERANRWKLTANEYVKRCLLFQDMRALHTERFVWDLPAAEKRAEELLAQEVNH